ncbi:carboxypeptidase-like regulatory domain-containing protein [uncultured Algibacter sp.]|uniref:carboxypeptidase-like regulatory domain-containing protein n=1 Tax=uncultured Algibacter sp. TaxID=298659 RepID=UPI00262F000A|nr:carboxypeptidase-like regulatory domain-containing protein [uncultured Algibacter sp.]
MKGFIYTILFLITATTFAQESGTINGQLLDIESNNAPLLYGRILIKETGSKVLSDENGLFKFGNLEEGTYTLVGSFTGYETQEIKIEVTSNTSTTITFNLAASTISLDDLMTTIASTD